ncbi:MAG TPA: Hsp20/alpha crystallin family protein [Magnetovibrio sp.]
MSVKVTKSSKKSAKKAAKSNVPTKGEVVRAPSELHPLQTLRHEIDSLFDNMLSGFPSMRLTRPSFDMDLWREPFRDPFRRFEDTFGALSKLSPRADLKETDKSVVITAELPGVVEADIDVTVSDGRLTVRAEKKEETRKDEDNYHLSERHYGSVQRTFSLPEAADADKATATFKDGVLTIDVPKKASSKAAAKKIPVKG